LLQKCDTRADGASRSVPYDIAVPSEARRV
jgi:hypothetical protein